MIEAWSVFDVRAVEDRARAPLPEGELMRRASHGLAGVARARLEDLDGSRVVALVGRGDNGGDALYAVRDLAAAWVLAAAVTLGRPDDAAVRDAREAGAVVVRAEEVESEEASAPTWRTLVQEADVVLDGLLGIGGRPGLRPEAAALVDAVADTAWVIAVDLPSGADPAGEESADELVVADETVTFSLCKPVHLLPATEPVVGRLTVVDIGLEESLATSVAGGARPDVERLTFDDVRDLWPVPDASSDKYSRGVVGIVAGSVQYPGAAVLSVLGALGAGPGMIRYLGPEPVQWLVHQAAPEVVTASGRVQAWVIGSGFDVEGDGEDAHHQRERAQAALASDLPVLVDAGALDLVEREPRSAPTLLTPHAGELARLLTRLGVGVATTDGQMTGGEVTRDQVTRAPLAHARAAARATGATVLLKGSTTLVVDPDPATPVRSQHDAPAWIATAGAGDVLGGIIGTLLAAGLDPRDAGSLGALVHGVAADHASAGGPLRVRDVAQSVAPAVRSLLTRPR